MKDVGLHAEFYFLVLPLCSCTFMSNMAMHEEYHSFIGFVLREGRRCQYLLGGLLLKRHKLAGLLNFGLEIDHAMVNLGSCSAIVGIGMGEIMIVD